MKKNRFIFLVLFACFLTISVQAQSTFFEQHVLTESFSEGYDVFYADINNDAHQDIIACRKGGEVVWYRNDGFQNFTKFSIGVGLAGVRSVRSADMNNDGYADLVCAAWQANKIAYFQNNGDESFTQFMVDDSFKGAHTVDLKDVNEDGFIDILCSGWDYYGHQGEIAWWESSGQEEIEWDKHLISDRFLQSPFVFGEDMDGDSDIDVLACGELSDEIIWWENDGEQYFGEGNIIDSTFIGAHTVIAKDVDLDGDMDVLGAAWESNKIAWYENIGEQQFIKHILPYLAGALWLDAADLDNDGDMDLMAAGQSSGVLYWYENDGNQEFTRWPVEGSFTSAFSVVPVDMDNDGDQDLLAIGRNSSKISWFENKVSTIGFQEHKGTQEQGWNIYPNPFRNVLNISGDCLGKQHQIWIFNSNGQMVLSKTTNNSHSIFNLSSQEKGIYHIRVDNNAQKTENYKVIKQ